LHTGGFFLAFFSIGQYKKFIKKTKKSLNQDEETIWKEQLISYSQGQILIGAIVAGMLLSFIGLFCLFYFIVVRILPPSISWPIAGLWYFLLVFIIGFNLRGHS